MLYYNSSNISVPSTEEYFKISQGNTRVKDGKLTVVEVLVNGVVAKALADTGCSAEAVISPAFAERASLSVKPAEIPHQVILGDGEAIVHIKDHVRSVDIGVKNYNRSTKNVPIMPLGEFDMILGNPWFGKLESQSESHELRWSVSKRYIKATVKGKTVILQGQSPEGVTNARSSKKYLEATSGRLDPRQKNNIEGGLMVLLHYSNNMNPIIIPTVSGDEYIPVGMLETSDNTSEGGEEHAIDVKIPSDLKHRHTSNSKKQIKQINDILNNVNVSDVHGNDNRTFKIFTPNEPQEGNAWIKDKEVFSRVEAGKNTNEELTSSHPKLPELIEEHGKVFSDWIPVNEIPDRGSANVHFRFKDPTPYSGKPYRLSPSESKALGEILEDMLKKGIIRPSNSPWGAPVFLVPKATGGYRLCADYRMLNSKLVAESYCLPASDMLFDRLQGSQYFTLQDCTWGYHQLRYEKESIPATAIRTHMGTFEFTVLNFGPSTGPAAWQRFIEQVLRPYLGHFCFIFLDDLIVFSKTKEEHLEHLQLIWKRLYANRIFLRLAKCKFMKTKIQYLGWVVENGKLSASPEKVAAVKDWPRPNNKSEVRSFVGFCNFYRRLIKNCSKRCAPLTDMTKDEIPNSGKEFAAKWTEKEENAFEDMKLALSSEPVITLPDMEKGFKLEIDASLEAIGGVLYQKDDTETWRVVAYMSKRLGGAQSRYDSGKLELLGLIVALTQWRHYLQGAKDLVIKTDNEALTSLRKNKNPSRMQQRWLHFIEGFQFRIEHCPGKGNIPADALSRQPGKEGEPTLQVTEDGDEPDVDTPDIALRSIILRDEDSNLYDEIPYYGYNEILYQSIQETVTHKPEELDLENQMAIDCAEVKLKTEHDVALQKYVKEQPREFIQKNGFIFKKTEGQIVLCIPDECEEIKSKILYQSHYIPTAGHYGISKTIQRIKRYYFWKNLTSDVKSMISECKICSRCKRMNVGPPHMSVHSVPECSWSVIAMDETSTVTPSQGYDCIWVFICKLTKMAHFVPATKEGLTSKILAKLFFDHIYKLHGLPNKIISDRDPRINCEFWQQLLKRAGMRANMSTAGRPETDGQSEVTVRACIDLLRSFVNSNQDNWIEFLSAVEYAYNDTVNSSTGYTPFEMNYGKHPKGISTILFESIIKEDNIINQDAIDLWDRLIKINKQARENLQKVNNQMSSTNGRRRSEVFQKGDLVLLHKDAAGRNYSKEKLANLYVGPFTVLRQYGDHAYLLSLPPGMEIDPVVNIRNLKRYPFNEDEKGDEEGKPLSVLPKLNQEINIQEIKMITGTDNIQKMIAVVDGNQHDVRDLIRRRHYHECLDYIDSNFYQLKLPTIVGRVYRKQFKAGIFEGIVTAYDPINIRAFEIAYTDGDSEWITMDQSRKAKALRGKPKKHIIRSIREKPFSVLVLCSGTGSVEKALTNKFGKHVKCIGVDINPEHEPEIVTDINSWDYKSAFSNNEFDIIWASPDCSQYSKGKTFGPRDLQKADDLVLKCLEIITYFKPQRWVVENSDGELKNRTFMKEWNKFLHTCSYCCYGFPYRKHTNIWTNAYVNLRKCTKDTPCRYVLQASSQRAGGEQVPLHPAIAQQGPMKSSPFQVPMDKRFTYQVPHKLTLQLLGSVIQDV